LALVAVTSECAALTLPLAVAVTLPLIVPNDKMPGCASRETFTSPLVLLATTVSLWNPAARTLPLDVLALNRKWGLLRQDARAFLRKCLLRCHH